MIEIDSKQTQKADWVLTHTLTQEQLKKLIAAKFARATIYQKAVRKRETALQSHR
jgi:hypothetical protein